MVVRFKEFGSRKLLKELYLTGYLPENDTTVIINDKRYSVITTEFDANVPMAIIHVRKIK